MTTKEHKYKAWDTVKKVMYSAYELGQDQETLSVDGRGFVNISGDSTKLSQFHTHLLPLEYTGLKDKNDKEIYEGDIIRCPSHWIGTVCWSESELQWWANDHDIAYLNIPEVIGNIYENKELLEH